MKALIRNDGETVTEDMGHSFIDWKTGAPLTNHDWFGGSYVLVNDYVRKDPADDFVPADQTPVVKVNPDMPVPVGDTIVIDGVTYTRTS